MSNTAEQNFNNMNHLQFKLQALAAFSQNGYDCLTEDDYQQFLKDIDSFKEEFTLVVKQTSRSFKEFNEDV